MGSESGDKIYSDRQGRGIIKGSRYRIGDVEGGTTMYAMSIVPGGNPVVARTAGSYVLINSHNRETGKTAVKFPSKKVLWLDSKCSAFAGRLSNPDRINESLGKASKKIFRGKRQTVRGSAKGPQDHPMGGKGSKGRHPCSAKGLLSKGYKTVRKRR